MGVRLWGVMPNLVAILGLVAAVLIAGVWLVFSITTRERDSDDDENAIW